jgi:hypothetical protein
MAVVDRPLPTGRVVYEMAVVLTRHERALVVAWLICRWRGYSGTLNLPCAVFSAQQRAQGRRR